MQEDGDPQEQQQIYKTWLNPDISLTEWKHNSINSTKPEKNDVKNLWSHTENKYQKSLLAKTILQIHESCGYATL